MRLRYIVPVLAGLLTACGDAEAPADPAEATADELGRIVDTTWTAGPGAGIASRRVGDGEDIAIFYGGYGATLQHSQRWADEAFRADLASRGIGVLHAVKGPAQSNYAGREIGNSKLAAQLVSVGADARRILVVAHSSGAFVAHELLAQLADGRDGEGVTKKKITYFNLDGASGPAPAARSWLASAHAVSVRDAAGARSSNAGVAVNNGATYAREGLGGHRELIAAAGVCNAGAKWCLHMVCTNEKPHNKGGLDVARDYTDFDGRPVQVDFFDELTDLE